MSKVSGIANLGNSDVVFVERAGKEVAVVVSVERDEQLYGQLRGRESDHPSA
jgi:hypothetical protein